MKKLFFKRYLKDMGIIVKFSSSKFYDYLEKHYNDYLAYCNANNYDYEDLSGDYDEAIAFKEMDEGKRPIIYETRKEIPKVNEHGERWSGAINCYTEEPIYGLDVPDWLDSEYKSFCENINADLINQGLVFIRVNHKIKKVISFEDNIFTLQDNTKIDLITEGINEMEVGCYPPCICSYNENNDFECKAIYGVSIEIGRFGYNEMLVFVAKEEYLQDILELC